MKISAVLLATAMMVPTAVAAEQTFSIRGGIASALNQYPYAAVDPNTDSVAPSSSSSVVDSGYGVGGFLSATYGVSDVFHGYGLETSLSFMHLEGDDSSGIKNGCSPAYYDALTVSHFLCMSGAEVSNTANVVQARVLATRPISSTGTELLAGLGMLSFENNITGQMFYGSEFSEQSRKNDFRGLGIVVGARHNMPLTGAWSLGLEGFAGVYRGDRDMRIHDNYEGNVGDVKVSDTATAYTLDLAVSASRDVSFFSRKGSLELGVGYNAVFDAVNTANYNPIAPTGSDSVTGKTDDRFEAVNLFVGYSIAF